MSELIRARALPAQSRIHLHGFAPGELHRVLRRVTVEPEDVRPGVETLERVTALPGRDALYDEAGNLIPSTRRNYLPEDLMDSGRVAELISKNTLTVPLNVELPDDVDVVEETVLYCGVAWYHYGHFLTDSVSRFWALEDYPDLRAIYLSATPDISHRLPLVKDVLGVLGLSGERLISPTRPTHFKRVIHPLPSIQHAFRIFHLHQRPHVRVAQALMAGVDREKFNRPIYLSRSALIPRLRRSPEELVLQEKLEKEGYTVLAPEQLKFADQIAIFNTAPVVAGLIGSAFHTVLFNLEERDIQLAMVSWGKIGNRYIMIDAIKGHTSHYFNTGRIAAMGENKRIESMQVDVDATLSFMSDAGLLRRKRAAAAPT